jgi:hypothetical protein
VIVAPDVFIGLVTFPRTRFAQARSEGGLAAQLSRGLRSRGLTTQVSIQEFDLLNPRELNVTPTAIRDSIEAELLIEREWREYLSGDRASLRLRALLGARRVWRRLRLAPPWQRKSPLTASGARSLIRLANIELSHLSIMDAALTSQARWCLILEDDAQTDDPQTLARQLSQFIEYVEKASTSVTTMNLSESFTPQQLGICNLLDPVPSDPLVTNWNLYASKKHVTNTVCAVLYREDFLLCLREQLAAIPLEPVIPIDFKINAAIIRGEAVLPGETWICSPAPVVQASGVPSPAVSINR